MSIDKFLVFRVPMFGIANFGLTEVRLYEETINKVREGHPEVPAELPFMAHAVEQAILNPTQIEISYSNSYVFVDHTSTNLSGDPLRVPVRSVTATSGRVASFFFASKAQANVMWRKG